MFTWGSDAGRVSRRYMWAALGAFLFSMVYEAFSHGVWSRWMLSLPLWPLAGAVLFGVCGRLGKRVAPWTRALWLCAAVTGGIGACLAGVFEIYGTDFPFCPFLWGPRHCCCAERRCAFGQTC